MVGLCLLKSSCFASWENDASQRVSIELLLTDHESVVHPAFVLLRLSRLTSIFSLPLHRSLRDFSW